MENIQIRRAHEQDLDAVRELFIKTYGYEYPYRDFYDDYWLKKTIYSDHYYFLVAEHRARIVGTASIYFEAGTYTDLLGEFGRLVVDPEYRGQGIGSLLMSQRLQFARRRLHFGFIEGRTLHPYAQRIAAQHGFAPVGFMPLQSLFRGRESLAVMAQLFGPAQELRRNHPHVIPQLFPLASKALSNMGLSNDLIVVEDVVSYPMQEAFEVTELEQQGLPYLLRIERGRLKRYEVFGNLMLSYGFFALQAREAKYLVAKRGNTVVGAIGFVHDRVGRNLKVLEMIVVDDAVAGFLLRELDRRAREELDVEYAEVAVSAYSPEMQHTLEQLGFSPVAYCPAYVFRGAERLDAVRMAKLYVPFELGTVELTPGMRDIYDIIVLGFMGKRIGIEIDELTRNVALFKGLTEAQLKILSGICKMRRFSAGNVIFRQGELSQNLYLVLSGEVDIYMEPHSTEVGRVLAGDVLGEISLVEGLPHSATAVVSRDSQLIMLAHKDFEALIQRYPRIGLTVLQNLARSLGNKLKATDIAVTQLFHQTDDPISTTARSG